MPSSQRCAHAIGPPGLSAGPQQALIAPPQRLKSMRACLQLPSKGQKLAGSADQGDKSCTEVGSGAERAAASGGRRSIAQAQWASGKPKEAFDDSALGSAMIPLKTLMHRSHPALRSCSGSALWSCSARSAAAAQRASRHARGAAATTINLAHAHLSTP